MKRKYWVLSLFVLLVLSLLATGALPRAAVLAKGVSQFTGAQRIFLPIVSKNLTTLPPGELVYQAKPGADWDIYTVDLAVGEPEELADDGDNGHPEWSPNGSRVVFHSDRDDDFDIYAMDADGSDVDQLTDRDGTDAYPTWSPDGDEIAFASDRDGDFDIYVMDADGSPIVNLTDEDDDDDIAQDTLPSWSPDGRWIVFQSDREGDDDSLYIMDARDGAPVYRLLDRGRDGEAPSWSPDGNWIAYMDNAGGDYEIWLVKPDGSQRTQLTDNVYKDTYPSWSPDSRWVVYSSDQSGFDMVNIFAINVATRVTLQLTDSGYSEAYASWKP